MVFSIIHPSRGRPEKSRSTFKRWFERASSNNYQWIASLDHDDPKLLEYDYINPLVSANRSVVDAINNGAKVATGDIFIVVSDDTDCTDGWDKKLLSIVAGKTDFILKTADGIQPWILTNPILDRKYYERFGYIYHPEYKHCFCDTELTCVADITGRKIKSDLLFKHNHYSVTKEKPDEVSKRADATWDHGEKLFLERYKRNFDLPQGGKIEDMSMIRWLERKAR